MIPIDINLIPIDINRIISFILNPTFTSWLLVLKILFIVVSLIFFGFIVFALVKTDWLKRLIIWDLQEFLTYRPFAVRKIVKQWREIKARLETGLESEYKLAVIEADKILDNTLMRIGFEGETLGERLTKLTVVSLPNIEEIKQVHQIRDNIIRDPDYRLNLDEAQRVIAIYEKTLTDLQAL